MYYILTYELLSKYYICSTKRIHIGLFSQVLAVWAGCRLAWPRGRRSALQCSSSRPCPRGSGFIHSFLSSRIRAPRLRGRALRRFAARRGGGSRGEDKAHYAQSAKLQLKPLTEEGALAGTTHRKRRWRRRATPPPLPSFLPRLPHQARCSKLQWGVLKEK